MDQKDLIKSKTRALVYKINYLFIDSLVRAFLAAKAPGILVGIPGKIFNLIWGKIAEAISNFAADNGYAFGVKLETANKIEGMNQALAELKAVEEAYDPSRPMTPEEKEADDKANEKIDDGLSWD